jgi:ketosteroid isomerase-like protein
MSEAELSATAHAWDRAMTTNDAEAIGRFMAEDWIIVGPDGSVDRKDRFLSLIASGDLTHDVMTSEDLMVRLYGDTALLIAKGVSGGTFKGQAFRDVERSSNVFVRRDGQWICVMTHLSKIAE